MSGFDAMKFELNSIKNIGTKIKTAMAKALSLSFLFSHDSDYDPHSLRVGDKGERVEELQRTLRVLEFYDYPELEGFFGTDTRSALMNFQKIHGIEVTGVCDRDTFAALDEALNECYPEIEFNGTMRLRSVGEDVKSLQQVLKTLGYYGTRPDGIFNANTASAVRTFQFDYGMAVDGIVNERLVKKINAVAASLRPLKHNEDDITPIEVAKSVAQADSVAKSVFHTDAVKIQWSAVNSAWRPGKVLTITDVETGISVELKRTGGIHHADAEPLTAEDTRKLKDIFGGSWSWARRPFVAQLSYLTAAASLCGMPHGDDAVSGNEVSGHFCMYFFESTDDNGYGIMDRAHARAIDSAAQFTFPSSAKEA